MHFRVYKKIYFAHSGQDILVCFVLFESTMNKAIFFDCFVNIDLCILYLYSFKHFARLSGQVLGSVAINANGKVTC